MTRILCLGDSITDCGRLFSADPLGKGYVKQLSCLLHNTDHRFSIENRGIDGFTLERLLQNTDFWLESSDPDIVTVLIGINDVGIMMNTRRSSAQQQDLMNKFVTRYELLAKKAILHKLPETNALFPGTLCFSMATLLRFLGSPSFTDVRTY